MLAIQDLLRRARFDPTGVAGVPVVWLFAFLTGDLDFVSVNNDNVVTHIHVRCERCFVFTTQAHGDDGGQAAQHDTLGVDQDPLLVDITRGHGIGFHISNPTNVKAHQGGTPEDAPGI